MACKACEKFKDDPDLAPPYVTRTCDDCGREYNVREPGAHGIGIKVRKGDRFAFPKITVTVNPLKSPGRFTSHGLKWFAEQVFLDPEHFQEKDGFENVLKKLVETNEGFFRNAEYLQDLDLDAPENAEEIYKRIDAHPKSIEWFGYMAAAWCHRAARAIEASDAREAAWATAVAERFRALTTFKTTYEEVVFMGHSAGRLLDLYRVWEGNSENADEGFWQKRLTEYAFTISQIFSVPVTFIGERAYVGGQSMDGKDARFSDFMLSGGSANEAILVEIKTPVTKLLGAKYRGNAYAPSSALSGAVVQVNDYCHTLRQNIHVAKSAGVELSTFNPRKVIIIGNYGSQLDSDKKKASFELFRTSLTGIDVITFDEFFQKIENLIKLFSVTRSDSKLDEASPS